MKVHGIEIEMEERVCIGGCGQKFRCTKGSTTVYAKAECHSVCQNREDRMDKPDRYYRVPIGRSHVKPRKIEIV